MRNSSCGTDFVCMLTITFAVLKLCNVIDWAWCWVLSPLWISIGIILFVIVAYFIIMWAFNRR